MPLFFGKGLNQEMYKSLNQQNCRHMVQVGINKPCRPNSVVHGKEKEECGEGGNDEDHYHGKPLLAACKIALIINNDTSPLSSFQVLSFIYFHSFFTFSFIRLSILQSKWSLMLITKGARIDYIASTKRRSNDLVRGNEGLSGLEGKGAYFYAAGTTSHMAHEISHRQLASVRWDQVVCQTHICNDPKYQNCDPFKTLRITSACLF